MGEDESAPLPGFPEGTGGPSAPVRPQGDQADTVRSEAAVTSERSTSKSIEKGKDEGDAQKQKAETVSSATTEALQEFFIPVWHQVRLTVREVDIVNHPAFARLADIYQLGQTHLVYRGATHKRWEHALGTVHAAQLIISALDRNFKDSEAKSTPAVSGRWERVRPLEPQEAAFVRLAALLHDVGHIAAGHTFEDELGLLDPHDADERLKYVLDREEWLGVPEANSLRKVIDEGYADFAASTGLDLSASEIFLELVSKSRVDRLKTTDRFRMRVCRDLVANTICADLIDYLHRDWYHLGKPRDFDARLLDYFELRQDVDTRTDVRFVVNLRERAEVRMDAVTAIFELLESRYQLGEVALFHRTKLVASAMLERLVAEVADAAGKPDWLVSEIDRLLECSDEELPSLLATLGEELAKSVKGERAARVRRILWLGRSLRLRQLHKQVSAFNAFELSGGVEFVRGSLGGAAGAGQRLSTVRSLERDFHLSPGSVVLYCPRKAPHVKIAQVQVLVHGKVDSLAEIEAGYDDPALTGGLLQAQKNRFDRLWRVQVSVEKRALAQLEEWGALRDFERTVESLVLNASRGSVTPEEAASDIARSLFNNPDFPTENKRLIDVADLHARSSGSGQVLRYGSGAPVLSSFWID